MAINRSQIPSLLRPGLAAITGKYKELPVEWTQLFSRTKSEMANEQSAEMRYTGLAHVKDEGGAFFFDNSPGERYKYNIQNIGLGLGYAFTREALDDNLYKAQFNPQSLGLNRSMAQTWDILHANLFNTATIYNTAVGGDGKALAATDHPIDGGTVANTPTVQLNLNESSIESALTTIRGFRDQAGMKMYIRGRKLVVPSGLGWAAERLTKTELRTETANNDISAIVSTGALRDGYVINDFFTSATRWGILTDVEENGLVHTDRTPYEIELNIEPSTGNLLVTAYERAGIGYFDWRSLWWATPTA